MWEHTCEVTFLGLFHKIIAKIEHLETCVKFISSPNDGVGIKKGHKHTSAYISLGRLWKDL